MAEETRPDKEGEASGAEGKRKKLRVTGLLFAGVLLLSALLPARYKAFSPLLFLLVPLFDVLRKLHDDSTRTGDIRGDATQSSYDPAPPPSGEPYSYEPKDPKDPRKYKPIG